MPARRRGVNFDITAEDRSDRAFRSVNQNLGNLQGRLRGVRSVMGPVLGAAAVAGMVAFTKKALDAGDAIAKAADKIGITTDALQEYRHAADLAGVESTKLDSAMEAFAKRFGELRANTGTLVTFLGKYDEQLLSTLRSQSDTTVALDIYIDAMGNAKNAADRAALGAAGFGRAAGVQMGLLVKNGTEELKRMRREAHELGLVLDERLLRNAEKAKDQLSILGRVIKTNLIAAVLELAPLISRVASQLTDMTPAITKFTEGILVWAGAFEAVSADRLIEEIDKLQGAIDHYDSTFNRAISAPKDLFALSVGWDTTSDIVDSIKARQNEVIDALVKAQQGIQGDIYSTGDLAAEQPDAVDPFGGLNRNARPRQKPLPQGPTDIAKVTAAIDTQIDALRRLDIAYAISREEGERVNDQLEREAEIRAVDGKLTEEQAAQLDKLIERRQQLEATVEKRLEDMDEEKDKTGELNKIWKDETLTILQDLQGGYKDLGDVALAVLERMITKLFEYVDAANAAGAAGGGGGGGGIFDILAGGISSIIGGGGGTSFPLSAAASSGISVTGTGGMLSGRAGGGPTEPGRMFEVAERTTGAGIFIPVERGGILPVRSGHGAPVNDNRGGERSINATFVFQGMNENTMRNPRARAQMRADMHDLVQDAARDT